MVPRIVILTGAGISAESGVPTFRDAGGLWEGHRIEDVASPVGFRRNPRLVHQFYNARRANIQTCLPNRAHYAVAELQAAYPDRVTLVTQNVDDLHERAGTACVLHMHGELLRVRCESCGVRSCRTDAIDVVTVCEACGVSGRMRPDIVWFGEMPFHMDEIEKALRRAEIFAAIGTSGHVYPAAGFVDMARSFGCHTVELNLQMTEGSARFHEHRFGTATEAVRAWVDSLLETFSAQVPR